MPRYAEGTAVSVDQSRGELTGLLARHGVQVMAWGTRPEADTLQFELAGRQFRFVIVRPSVDEIYALFPNHRDTESKIAAEWRRRWRAHVLLLKAKLEFTEGDGPSSVIREFMPYMLVAGGITLEEAVSNGGVKALAAGG